MYSGGLDSLGMLYKLLTEEDYRGYGVHVHHIHISNVEQRARAEAITVKIALEELRRLGFNFGFSESSIAAPAFNHKFMFDMDAVRFFAGYLCQVNPEIKLVAVGANATEFGPDMQRRRVRANAILAAFTPVETIYPVGALQKREIFAVLPPTLRDKFWSCRTPVYSETNIKFCGRCNTRVGPPHLVQYSLS